MISERSCDTEDCKMAVEPWQGEKNIEKYTEIENRHFKS